VHVRVIAGHALGVTGAVVRATTEPVVLDIVLPAGAVLEAPLPHGHNAFAYVYDGGSVDVGDAPATRVDSERMAILSNDPQAHGVRLHALTAARVLLVAGAPLREPIVQHGPFVMNTVAQIHQAFEDYQRGALAH
jgi:redox-sensitive bicupin YhaK (pirin superfamily)